MISFNYANAGPSNFSSLNASFTDLDNKISRTQIADYTLLVYMIGSDFELKNYSASKDIEEIKDAGIASNINIVLQTGGGLDSEKADRNKLFKSSET